MGAKVYHGVEDVNLMPREDIMAAIRLSPPAVPEKEQEKKATDERPATAIPTAKLAPGGQVLPAGLPTILLAEDDDRDITLIDAALRNAGVAYQLKVVKDGAQAIRYLEGVNGFADRTQNPFPVLLLLDLQMPQLNGFGVLEWLKQTATGNRLLVVVLSGSNQKADMDKAFQLGANSYLVKSGGYEDLINFLKSFDLRP